MPLKVKVAYGITIVFSLLFLIAAIAFAVSQWEWFGPFMVFGLFLIVVIAIGSWTYHTIEDYESKQP